jgi:F-type H+-transporting ATPase subunit gamma
MANTKIIKQKIKAIGNIKKITKTMEMVSFAKMKKSATSVSDIMPYINEIKNTLMTIGQKSIDENKFSLIQKGAGENELVIIFASNKGLCGSFNTNVYKKLKKEIEIKKQSGENITHAICFGKFAEKIARRLGLQIELSYLEVDKITSVSQIAKVENLIRNEFINKKFKRVSAVYTNFIKIGFFDTTFAQIYPLVNISQTLENLNIENVGDRNISTDKVANQNQIYTFEPSVSSIVDVLIPKLVKIILYSYILESRASEHSSRSFAMKRASEAAGDIQADLKLLYNKVRQDGITQEIAEISAGANAA